MKSIGLLDCAVIVAFFAVMIGVGLFYSRRQKSSGQYFGSDKSTPWWLAGVSIYMNSFSALAFVMYSTLAYKYGLIAATMCWASVPAMLLGLWFVALKLRRSAQTSPLDFVRDRFGGKMNQTLVWLGIPMQLLDGAFKLLAIGTVVGMVMKTALPPAPRSPGSGTAESDSPWCSSPLRKATTPSSPPLQMTDSSSPSPART